MRIFYDVTARNIDIVGSGRFFSSGSLEAIASGNNVIVQYKDSGVQELNDHFSVVQKQDNSQAGTTVTEVVDYLNNEFNKGIIKGVASFSLLSLTKVVTDSRVKVGDVISITPQGSTLNESVWSETVTTDGQFTVRRKVIDILSGLTSGLSFGWFRI